MRKLRKDSLGFQLIQFSTKIVLIMAIVVIVFVLSAVNQMAHYLVKEELKVAAEEFYVAYDAMYPGEWSYTADGILQKGGVTVVGDDQIMEKLKGYTNLEYTMFYGEELTMVGTTMEMVYGDLEADEVTVTADDIKEDAFRDAFEKQLPYFGENVLISEEKYYVYFCPIVAESDTTELIVTVARSSADMNQTILIFSALLLLAVITIVAVAYAAVLHRLQKRVINPVERMSAAMEEFAYYQSGDDAARQRAARNVDCLNIQNEDEIGRLYQSLALLTWKMTVYVDQLKEEQKLKEDLEVTRKMNRAKDEFLSNVSHEIRTPINAILGMDEMILRESGENHICRYAENIRSAGRTLLSLVNDILDFSKLEEGRIQIVPTEYNVESLLKDLVQMMRAKCEEKGLLLNVELTETMPAVLYGDEIRLRQCMLNLLSNAVKYTNEGQIDVSLSYHWAEDTEHIYLIFRVTDTGVGIRPEDMEKLFDRFERLDEQQNQTIQGSGLGLSIVRHLLSLMDSHLEVESKYGEGSLFSFSVRQRVVGPWQVRPFEWNANEDKEVPAEVTGPLFRAPKVHVLYVDDIPVNLQVVEGFLKRTAVQLDMLESGMEALEKTKKCKYDLIFMDHRMPEMDGVETLEHIRKDSENLNIGTPCIALTANVVSGSELFYEENGFAAYLAKPVDGHALESLMMEYLPKEKLLLPGTPEYDAAEVATLTENEIEPKLKLALIALANVEGVDMEAGISYCAGEENYWQTVEGFAAGGERTATRLQEFLEEDDLENYGILVHGLKSSARLVGALDLSFRAEYLERCADEKKRTIILEKTEKLLADLRALVKQLEIVIAEYAEQENAQDKPQMTMAEWQEACLAISEFAQVFDFSGVDMIMEHVKEYRIPESEQEKYEAIKQYVRDVDRESLLAAMQSWTAE